MQEIVVGIFVGGESRRMGEPKGLLKSPRGTESLVESLYRIALPFTEDIVLVGANEAYAALAETLSCPVLRDRPAGVGPLGGLAALLEYASGRPAVALACDMPYLGEANLRALIDAGQERSVAATRDGRFEPFFAVYHSSLLRDLRAYLEEDRRDLQGLLRRADVKPWEGSDADLQDWDCPSDVRR